MGQALEPVIPRGMHSGSPLRRNKQLARGPPATLARALSEHRIHNGVDNGMKRTRAKTLLVGHQRRKESTLKTPKTPILTLAHAFELILVGRHIAGVLAPIAEVVQDKPKVARLSVQKCAPIVVCAQAVPARKHGAKHGVRDRSERAARHRQKPLPANVEVDQVRCLGVLVGNKGRLPLKAPPVHDIMIKRKL